MVNTIKPNIT